MKSHAKVYLWLIKSLLCLALVIPTLTVVKGQEINEKEMVGFACGFGGESSETVVKVTRLLRAHRYQKISNLLSTGNNAERFLAVISIEKLSHMGRYQIAAIERKQIEAIKASGEKVSVCSGCTYFTEVSLSEMFREDNFLGSDGWITGALK